LLEGILNILLSPKEVEKVKNKIDSVENLQKVNNKENKDNDQTNYGYDEDKNIYKIPLFTLKEKDIILPKLSTNDEWIGMELKNNSKIEEKISKIEQKLDIQELVRNKVSNFSDEKLENMLMDITSREFKFIEVIGGVLGLLIGIIQLIIQSF